MVNCKNCGAPLSLENAYCSHCGTANLEAQEHLKKLEQLDKDYKKTKFEVINEVKKNKKGYGVLTILIVILLMNLLLIPLHNNSYRIADKIIASSRNVSEIKKELDSYLQNKDYERFVITYEKYAVDYRTFEEYNKIYYLADAYLRVKEQVSNHFFGKELYSDSLVRACQYIKEYKDDYDRYNKFDNGNNDFITLNNEFDLFVKTFLKLKDEDLIDISKLSESEILLLVSERLTYEE